MQKDLYRCCSLKVNMVTLEQFEKKLLRRSALEEKVKKYGVPIATGVAVGTVFHFFAQTSTDSLRNHELFNYLPLLWLSQAISIVKYGYNHYHKNLEGKKDAIRDLSDRDRNLFSSSATATFVGMYFIG